MEGGGLRPAMGARHRLRQVGSRATRQTVLNWRSAAADRPGGPPTLHAKAERPPCSSGRRTAMKPPRVVFVCQECGAQAPKWMGRCVECGAWNSLVEERAANPSELA